MRLTHRNHPVDCCYFDDFQKNIEKYFKLYKLFT